MGSSASTTNANAKENVTANATATATATANATANPNATANTNGGTRNKKQGGYRPTKKDKAALKKWKQGKSIGFTMRSSLKAKGLLPRANGLYRVSAKYKN
jgi:hypothetical protein